MLNILILGGTAFLGRAVARDAVARGHRVTCAARGRSGDVVAGAQFVQVDRLEPASLDPLARERWDCVVDVSWQPGMVRSALETLAGRARQWIYVSSASVYAEADTPGADESAAILTPTSRASVGVEEYGEAKAACEIACREQVEDRLLVARAGLIGGPGDTSDRSGYWVARAVRDPHGPMLVPDDDAVSQVVDVRDLAAWLLTCAEIGTVGVFNTLGPQVPVREWVDLCRSIGGHDGEVVPIPGSWLLERGVTEFAGPRSIPMWVHETPDMVGWARRSGAAAQAAGLRHRPRAELVRDVLAWERGRGLDRPRRAGLSAADERELLAEWLR
jgi:nucleoside-diphosphate-sugar epimerase